jgi:glycosyltransferase involved in cell wall biosynthesis
VTDAENRDNAQEVGIGEAPLSVIIPTRNEQRNLADSLASVGFAAERIVFDSFSDDATVDIARAAGVPVVQRRFDVFSTHKNWAIDNIDLAHDWILLLDADERVTPELRAEIEAVVYGAGVVNGYYIARQNLFAGKWIRHAGMYPDWQLRLFRRGRARYEDRLVHEHMVVDGPTGFLRNHLIHHDYKGIERYFDRHNVYSSLEAVEIHRSLTGRGRAEIRGNLFVPGPTRRRALKNFAYRYVPMRALAVFLYMYIVRLGFLDGRIGFRYCLLRASYEYQISLKLLELKDPGSAISERYEKYLTR